MALLIELAGRTLALEHDGPGSPQAADGGLILPPGRIALLHGLGDALFYRHGQNSWSPCGWRRLSEEPLRIANPQRRLTADDTVWDDPARHHSSAVAALDAGDGRVLWEVDTAGDLEDLDVTRRFVDVDTTPAVVDGIVYVASFSGGLYGLELETGTVRVHENQLKAITAITGTPDALILSSAQDGVVCLDLPGLTPRWQHAIHHGAPGRTDIQGDTIYVAESLGALLALSLADGQETGRIHTAHGVTAPPTLGGRRGFVLSNAATLYAFSY